MCTFICLTLFVQLVIWGHFTFWLTVIFINTKKINYFGFRWRRNTLKFYRQDLQIIYR